MPPFFRRNLELLPAFSCVFVTLPNISSTPYCFCIVNSDFYKTDQHRACYLKLQTMADETNSNFFCTSDLSLPLLLRQLQLGHIAETVNNRLLPC